MSVENNTTEQLGRISFADLSAMTGFSENIIREELVKAGNLTSDSLTLDELRKVMVKFIDSEFIEK